MKTPPQDGIRPPRGPRSAAAPLSSPTGSRRTAPSGLAAVAVVIVMVLIWWLFSGNGPQGPAGNESRYASPDQGAGPDNLSSDGAAGGSLGVSGDGSDPFQGTAPGSSGSEDPGADDGDGGTGAAPGPQLTSPDGVRIDNYVLEGDRLLALNYVTGDPACVGTVGTPRVLEDAASVVVTLTLTPPQDPPTGPCPELAMLSTVRVDLDSPLAGRSVLDGSFDPQSLVRSTERVYE